MNTEYKYYYFGKHVFRVKMDKINDHPIFGVFIRYEIQDPVDIPQNFWQRLKQFFTVASYHLGYWIPTSTDDTLEERIINSIKWIIEDLDIQERAKKVWETL